MTTLERINALMLAKYLPPVRHGDLIPHYSPGTRKFSSTPCHDVLDRLDRHCGIITRYRPDKSLAHVGERLARLERHITVEDMPPYFHLGASAENLAQT